MRVVIAVDASPLVPPGSGTARALAARLAAWEREPPPWPVVLFTPRASLEGAPRPGRVVTLPARTPRAFRRRLAARLSPEGARVLYSPFAAFPRTDVPVVATVHELPFVRCGPVEGRVRAWRHRDWLRRGARACAALVVPSASTRGDVTALCPQVVERVHVIPNGFDPAPWEAAAAATARASEPLVVAVGTGHGAAGPRKKGVDVLLAALARLPGVRAVLVGRLPGRPPAGIEVREALEDEALRRLVASAHVLVHPARSEGFGYPPLEAMAAGTPVVTTDGGALPETVGDAALVVPACDAGALADAVRRVLDDAALAARLVAAGRVRARAFDPAASAARLGALLVRAGGGP